MAQGARGSAPLHRNALPEAHDRLGDSTRSTPLAASTHPSAPPKRPLLAEPAQLRANLPDRAMWQHSRQRLQTTVDLKIEKRAGRHADAFASLMSL
jgi:hypothetical protein